VSVLRRLWRRHLPTFRWNRFRLHGEPSNGTWMPLAITQIIGGRSWSLALTRQGPPTSDASDLDGACHSVWLHGKWRWLTSQMTTEEREAFADAVDRYGDLLADGEERLPVERWWRDGVTASG